MTENVTITFSAVVKINEGVDMKDLLFNQTEWLGEPKSAGGCVIALIPKEFSTNSRREMAETKPAEDLPPLVKAVRAAGLNKWVSKKSVIATVLHVSAGYELMIQNPNNSIIFSTSEKMAGKEVMVDNEKFIVGAA